VVRIGEIGSPYKILVGKCLGNPFVDIYGYVRVTVRWIVGRYVVRVGDELAQGCAQRWALVSAVFNVRHGNRKLVVQVMFVITVVPYFIEQMFDKREDGKECSGSYIKITDCITT
jgi:hypothetical protein